MPETIINLYGQDVVLLRLGYPSVRFPASQRGPDATISATRCPGKDTLISTIVWGTVSLKVLPPLQEGIYYIVSPEFGYAVGRADLLVPFWGQISADGHELLTKALVLATEALPPRDP